MQIREDTDSFVGMSRNTERLERSDGVSEPVPEAPAFTPNRGGLLVCRILLILAGCVALYTAVGTLFLPLGPDQAIWTWVGDVILAGGTPYHDAWEIKGPLTHYIYATVAAIFGHHEWSIRVFDLGVMVGACYAVRRAALHLSNADNFAAYVAVVLLCLMYYAGGYADTAQAEGWGGLLITLTVLCLTKPVGRERLRMAVVGALVAVATLIKPTYATFMILPLVGAVRHDRHKREWLTTYVYAVVPFLGIVAFTAVALAKAGALRDLADVFQYVYSTYEPSGRKSTVGVLLEFPGSLFHTGLLIPFCMVPLALWRIGRSTSGHIAAIAATWLALCIFTLVIQRRYWQDHWLPSSFAIAVLYGVAAGYLRERVLSQVGYRGVVNALAALGIVATLGPCAWRAISRNDDWPIYAVGLRSRDAYIEAVTTPFNEVSQPFNYRELETVAAYVNKTTSPQDSVAIWGWDVSIYLMSNRKSATRFGVFQGLNDAGPLRQHYRELFLSELEARAPKDVVIDTRGAWYLSPGEGLRELSDFPQFQEYLLRNYRLQSNVNAYQVWSRNIQLGPTGKNRV